MRNDSRVPVVSILIALLIQPLGASPVVAQVAAPGAPYVDCTQAAATHARLASGLGVQREAIRRQEALLDALRQERAAGTKEAREKLAARSADALKSHAADEVEALKALREKALQLPDPGDTAKAAARLKWLKQVSLLEKSVSALVAIPDAATSGYAYGLEVQRQSHTVAEHLAAADKLFVDSGLAEALGGHLAKAGGPLGVAAFEGSLFLLDHLLAGQNDWDRLLEEQQAADHLNTMRRALSDVEEKMANLAADCPAPLAREAAPPAPATLAPSAPPSSPVEQAPPANAGTKSGRGGPKAVGLLLGAGLAAGAAVYAGSLAGDLAITGTCVSNRFCIVSVFGSGCECAGSVNGGCDWTGPAAGSGGGCGAGTPCASNLSCNNGRCEGAGGRCPF